MTTNFWIDDVKNPKYEYGFGDLLWEWIKDATNGLYLLKDAINTGKVLGLVCFDHDTGGHITGTQACEAFIELIEDQLSRPIEKITMRLSASFNIYGISGYSSRKTEVQNMRNRLFEILESDEFEEKVKAITVNEDEDGTEC